VDPGLVVSRCRPGAIIVLDDIDFSPDMAGAWEKVSQDPRVVASLSVTKRAGVVELGFGHADLR
jgi:predicted O-methyltransferase YrrM